MLIRSIAIVIRADRAGRSITKHSSLKFVDMMTLSKLMRPTRFDSRWVCRFVLALWQIDSNLYNENAAATTNDASQAAFAWGQRTYYSVDGIQIAGVTQLGTGSYLFAFAESNQKSTLIGIHH